MSSRSSLLLLLCLTFTAFVGCGGEPPDKEMQQAQGAIDAARAAGADVYATDEFGAAQLALKNAVTAVGDRDYRLALNHALDSRDRAQSAAKQAADNKAAARADAQRALDAADQALDTVREKLKLATERKIPARSTASLRGALDTAERRLQEARASFEKGLYLDIPGHATGATASLSEPSQQLDALMAAPVRRRR